MVFEIHLYNLMNLPNALSGVGSMFPYRVRAYRVRVVCEYKADNEFHETRALV